MDTRGYGYNQICVRIYIIIGSQIPVYYIRWYSFSYPPRARDGFYPHVYPWAWVILPPLLVILLSRLVIAKHEFKLGGFRDNGPLPFWRER